MEAASLKREGASEDGGRAHKPPYACPASEHTHTHSALAGSCGLAVRPKDREVSVGADAEIPASVQPRPDLGSRVFVSESLATREAPSPPAIPTLAAQQHLAGTRKPQLQATETQGLDTVSILSPVHFQGAAWGAPAQCLAPARGSFSLGFGERSFPKGVECSALRSFPAGPTPYTPVSVYTWDEAGQMRGPLQRVIWGFFIMIFSRPSKPPGSSN